MYFDEVAEILSERMDYKTYVDLQSKGISTGKYKKINYLKDLSKDQKKKLKDDSSELNKEQKKTASKEYLNKINSFNSKDSFQNRMLKKDNENLYKLLGVNEKEKVAKGNSEVSIRSQKDVDTRNNIKKILAVYFPGRPTNIESDSFGRRKPIRWPDSDETKINKFYSNLLNTTKNSNLLSKIVRDSVLTRMRDSTGFTHEFDDRKVEYVVDNFVKKNKKNANEKERAEVIYKAVESILSSPVTFPSVGSSDFPSASETYYDSRMASFRSLVDKLLLNSKGSEFDLNEKIARDVLTAKLWSRLGKNVGFLDKKDLNKDKYESNKFLQVHTGGTENEKAEESTRKGGTKVIHLEEFEKSLSDFVNKGTKMDSFYVILNAGVVEPLAFTNDKIFGDAQGRDTKGIDGLGYDSKKNKIFFVENKGSNFPDHYTHKNVTKGSENYKAEVEKFIENCEGIGVTPVWDYSSSITSTNKGEENATQRWQDLLDPLKKAHKNAHFVNKLEMDDFLNQRKIKSVSPDFASKKSSGNLEGSKKRITSLLKEFLNRKVGGLFFKSGKSSENKAII